MSTYKIRLLDAVNESSLWTAAFAPGPREPVMLPERTDAAIVGAGYTGLSAALALARRGVETTVLEAERVGSGASSRNGGMVLTGLKLGPDTLLRRYGERDARALFKASLNAIDVLEGLIAAERIECDYSRAGHLEVACKQSHFERLVRTQRMLDRVFGHCVRVLSRNELREEIGSMIYAGALLDERSGALDPYRYVLGLAEAAQRAGATVVEKLAVARIERRGDGWLLETARGQIRCKRILLATGAYAGQEFRPLRRRFVPLGSYVIATRQLPSELTRRLIPKGRMIFDTKHLLHYFRITPDSRVLFGGRAAFVPASAATTRQSAHMLRRDMVRTFPALHNVEVEYAWGGTLDVTLDLMPHAGEIDGCYYAIGYAGHGVALATLLGTLTAGAMMEQRPVRPFERSLPSAPLGLYSGRPWFLPLVGAWERFADMVS